MELSAQAISEYQRVFKRQYGIDLTKDQAKEQAIKLLRVFRIIYRPIPDLEEMKLYETKQA